MFFLIKCRLIIDGVMCEFIFTLDFFNLKPKENKMFTNIFRQILNFTLETIKNLIANSFDCYGLLLLILLNDKNKKIF